MSTSLKTVKQFATSLHNLKYGVNMSKAVLISTVLPMTAGVVALKIVVVPAHLFLFFYFSARINLGGRITSGKRGEMIARSSFPFPKASARTQLVDKEMSCSSAGAEGKRCSVVQHLYISTSST